MMVNLQLKQIFDLLDQISILIPYLFFTSHMKVQYQFWIILLVVEKSFRLELLCNM